MTRTHRNRTFVLVVAMAMALALAAPAASAAADKVLILGTTVWGGAGSAEAAQVEHLGLEPHVVDAQTWSQMTTAEFGSYRAIVLGDPLCGGLPQLAPAEANAAVWGKAVDGNVIAIGTDPTYHVPGGARLVEGGIGFAADVPGKTGAYIVLSCAYDNVAPGTDVGVLDGISDGSFTVNGIAAETCFDDVHIVAQHPALAVLRDQDLSNWECSVHEVFDHWPSDFMPLAVARDLGAAYTAPDGTVGTPYILARGAGLVSTVDILLMPGVARTAVGGTHTVTANVRAPQGTRVTFEVTDGPNRGVTGTANTDSTTNAHFSYSGGLVGTDTLQASFVNQLGRTRVSNTVTNEWYVPPNPPVETTPPPPVLAEPPPPPPPPPPEAAVAGETVVSGRARLRARSGCLHVPFSARVVGLRISAVRFALDGRTLRTVQARRGRSAALRIPVRRLRAGAHRVTARVTFVRASRTGARTLRASFLRCRAARRAQPRFTG